MKNFKEISISHNASVKMAMQKMDSIQKKLLIVLDEDEDFLSLISIGDIQRFIIKEQDFEAPLSKALRSNVITANSNHSSEDIKSKMLELRTEYMPILNDEGKLVDVIFWENLIKEKKIIQKGDLNLPVVIMAGGKGSRLQPITHIIPKPLIPIGEKPIMQIIMEHFQLAGCNNFFVSLGYKASMVESYFEELPNKSFTNFYFKEEKPMGTAGSLSLIKNKIKSPFFVSNCDIIIEQDYSEIYQYHKENKNELTAVAFVKNIKIPYGTLNVGDNGILETLTEKPEFTYLVNAGMYILEPHLLGEIPENTFFHITHLMESIVKRNGNVGVFPITEGSWLDIGQWKEYQKTLRKYGQEINL